jgi:hypothetical protein
MKKVILSGNKPPNAAVANYLHKNWLERSKEAKALVISAADKEDDAGRKLMDFKEDAVRQLMDFVGGARELRRLISRVSKKTKRKRSRPRKWGYDHLLLAETDGSDEAIKRLADRHYHADAIKQKKAMIKRLQRLRDKLGTK